MTKQISTWIIQQLLSLDTLTTKAYFCWLNYADGLLLTKMDFGGDKLYLEYVTIERAFSYNQCGKTYSRHRHFNG